ncbi:MAG TPA: hypothetical protein VK576_03455 [Thermoleophilia bacterium]|nr:hypothetical protein [Thermoleophilia bacterium]
MGGSIYNFGLQLGGDHAIPDREEWYRKAAEAGDPEAMRFLGDLLGSRGDRAGQLEWYQKAVAAGDEQAAGKLQALSLDEGEGVPND